MRIKSFTTISLGLLLITFFLFFSPTSTQAAASPEVTCDTTGINTAIGCLHVGSPKDFTEDLVRWAMGIAGLVAMLFIVYSGFLIMTSSGNPKQVAAGKELLTAAVSGLVLLVLSAFLLNFIGVQVLRLPNF